MALVALPTIVAIVAPPFGITRNQFRNNNFNLGRGRWPRLRGDALAVADDQ